MPPERLEVESIKSIGLRSFEAQLRPKQTIQPLHEIRIPQEVKELIHNPCFNNRYAWLIREYGEEFLLRVAEMSKKLGADPKRYFATACSKTNIERTRQTIAKYYEKAKAIAEVIEQRPTVFKGFIYKNIHRLSAERLTNALARSSDSINPGASFVLLTKL